PPVRYNTRAVLAHLPRDRRTRRTGILPLARGPGAPEEVRHGALPFPDPPRPGRRRPAAGGRGRRGRHLPPVRRRPPRLPPAAAPAAGPPPPASCGPPPPPPPPPPVIATPPPAPVVHGARAANAPPPARPRGKIEEFFPRPKQPDGPPKDQAEGVAHVEVNLP